MVLASHGAWSRFRVDYRFRDDRANSTSQFDLPEMLVNATGLLPNDRTHVFKLFGSYATRFGLTLGASFIAESGIPLSEHGGSSIGYPLNFVTERGSNGRTPALWDLGLRSVYALGHANRQTGWGTACAPRRSRPRRAAHPSRAPRP